MVGARKLNVGVGVWLATTGWLEKDQRRLGCVNERPDNNKFVGDGALLCYSPPEAARARGKHLNTGMGPCPTIRQALWVVFASSLPFTTDGFMSANLMTGSIASRAFIPYAMPHSGKRDK